jgi:hypothetical protein
MTGFNYTLDTSIYSILYVKYFAYLLGINRPAKNLLVEHFNIYPQETVAGVSFATVIWPTISWELCTPKWPVSMSSF